MRECRVVTARHGAGAHTSALAELAGILYLLKLRECARCSGRVLFAAIPLGCREALRY